MTLAALLRWFLEHQDPLPERLHVRGVWADPADGAGSALGAPAFSRAFRDYLERGGRAVRHERVEGPCSHPLRRPGELCPSCAIRDAAGRPMAESGRATGERVTYRWPMAAAIGRCAGAPVRAGYPRFDVVLRALAASGGDVSTATAALAGRYPPMGDPGTAVPHIHLALAACRARYRRDAPGRPLSGPGLGASEAPRDGEAAA